MSTTRKKLIEVAMPLDAINKASAREKSIRHGHPSTLHLWWARRPLAACRAVLFGQLVDDPSAWPDRFPTEAEQDAERQRIFRIIEALVTWENSNDAVVLDAARQEIARSHARGRVADGKGDGRDEAVLAEDVEPKTVRAYLAEVLPPVHDPFAGGGSIPLEAQRLGLRAIATDLNPVAVMINKALIEIPPKFAGRAPVGPPLASDKQGVFKEDWPGAAGLAEDVRRYGAWMREEAYRRIGHLYPKVTITEALAQGRPDLEPYVGQARTVIAWLWARTVASPNPAFRGVHVPLVSNFFLSTKKGKETWVEPVVEGSEYRFEIRRGTPGDAATIKMGTKLGRGANFGCIVSGTPITPDHIKAEGKAGRMGARLMAVVLEGNRTRLYVPPTQEQERIAASAEPEWRPEPSLPQDPRNFWTVEYGLTTFGDLFTPRQLVALTTFSDLVREARAKVIADAKAAGWDDSSHQRADAGRGEILEWHPKPLPPSILAAARKLRKHMTNAEQRLWHCVRGKQLGGFKFRKQHPIGRYVLDFYCAARTLAIEVDGFQHGTREGREKDRKRTAWLEQQGITVLRFWNYEVFDNLGGVLERIWGALQATPGGGLSTVGRPSGGGLTPLSSLPEGGYTPLPSRPPAGGREQEHANSKDLLLPPAGGGREGGLDAGDTGAIAYGEAMASYFAFVLSRSTDRGSTICTWDSSPKMEALRNTFGRQAIPMTWDFAEGNPFSASSGNWDNNTEWVAKVFASLPATSSGTANQSDATNSPNSHRIISTDPPYYDNIGYADLSDFFYVWLRRSLRTIYPKLFGTMLVPKARELVATPYRHGGKENAESFFLQGMTRAIKAMVKTTPANTPVTIYYAFKQAELKKEGVFSTGWETFLGAVLEAGFAVVGTWPVRTELSNRMIASGTNALASSIVLVCRKRPTDAPTVTRGQLRRLLARELPEALKMLQKSHIAPVDLAQASIGPGMAVFSRHAKVLEADGTPMTVRSALQLIHQVMDEIRGQDEGMLDRDTRFAITWFESHGFEPGPYGDAETLAKARSVSVSGVAEAGVLHAAGGKVRLLRRDALPKDWDPATDKRLTVWEATQHLIKRLDEAGETGAARLLTQLDRASAGIADKARDLSYRLYTVCERQGWAEEARAYNGLVIAWPELAKLAGSPDTTHDTPAQRELFE